MTFISTRRSGSATRRSRLAAVPAVLTLALAAVACEAGDPVSSDTALAPQGVETQKASARGNAPIEATLKAATSRFHSLRQAEKVGYVQVSGCVEEPGGAAAMGIHYARLDLLGDAAVEPTQPEALVYEPQADGRLELVAIEYIIPFPFHGPEEAPPVLFGQSFSRNDTNGFWALHVWLYRDNPRGLYSDFNPNVTCQHAPAA